jgi:hypothetical protein
MVAFLSQRQDYSTDLFSNKKSKTDPALAAQVLPQVVTALEALPNWERQALHDLLINFATAKGLKNGQVMWPVRIAISARITPGGAIENPDHPTAATNPGPPGHCKEETGGYLTMADLEKLNPALDAAAENSTEAARRVEALHPRICQKKTIATGGRLPA